MILGTELEKHFVVLRLPNLINSFLFGDLAWPLVKQRERFPCGRILMRLNLILDACLDLEGLYIKVPQHNLLITRA